MHSHVEYELADGASVIRLNRPEKLNALTLEMWDAVAAELERAVDDGARVAVLTGTGRAFCAGDDIATLEEIETEQDVRELADTVLACFDAIEESPLPVVGKANGSAYGGGFELLLACDLTVAPRSASFSLPETRIGAYPFYGAKRLARMVGRQRAADLALAGREISAEQAVEWGLFARAVPDGEVDETVDDLIAGLTRASPASLETTKRWLNATLEFSGENDAMRAGLGYLFAGFDAHEGAAAFLEDREPGYSRQTLGPVCEDLLVLPTMVMSEGDEAYAFAGAVPTDAADVSNEAEAAAAVASFVKERLAKHAYPREVEFVPELPKISSGKIFRIELRERETREAE